MRLNGPLAQPKSHAAHFAHFTQHPRLAGVPFILLSDKPHHLEQQRAMALGADD